MTDAGDTVRSVLVAALSKEAALAEVAGLGLEPTTGSLPQIDIAIPLVSDWGTKSEAGREVRTFVALRAAKGQRGRMPAMTEAIERAGAAIGGIIDGWSVASAVMIRTQISDERDGTRVARIEHRIRILAN